MDADSPPVVARRFDWRQADLLADRYWEIWLGDRGTLFLMLLQAPVIAGFIVLAWQDAKETPTLHLFLCLAALWVGCINACREIVKERALFKRERCVGVGVGPYLYSKMWVLGILDLVSSVLLVGIVYFWVGLAGSRLALVLVLWLTALTGTALGLAVSAFSSTSDRAVGLVPLVVLPQILFTSAFLPEGTVRAVAKILKDLTLLGWSFDLYDHVRVLGSEPKWWLVSKAALALVGLGGALLALAAFLLWTEE